MMEACSSSFGASSSAKAPFEGASVGVDGRVYYEVPAREGSQKLREIDVTRIIEIEKALPHCPVLHQMYTIDNLPVVFSCGHLTSKEAWEAMRKSGQPLRCSVCREWLPNQETLGRHVIIEKMIVKLEPELSAFVEGDDGKNKDLAKSRREMLQEKYMRLLPEFLKTGVFRVDVRLKKLALDSLADKLSKEQMQLFKESEFKIHQTIYMIDEQAITGLTREELAKIPKEVRGEENEQRYEIAFEDPEDDVRVIREAVSEWLAGGSTFWKSALCVGVIAAIFFCYKLLMSTVF